MPVTSRCSRLGLDHIDLYQLHRLDPDTDREESLGALTDLVQAGKVRMVGTSAASAHEIVELMWVAEQARTRATLSASSRCTRSSPRAIERAVLPACQRLRRRRDRLRPAQRWVVDRQVRTVTRRPTWAPVRHADSSRSNGGTYERAEIQRKFDLVDELRSLAQQAGIAAAAPRAGIHSRASRRVGRHHRAPHECATRRPARGADVRLDADVLDRIDALVAPGTDVDPANEVSIDSGLAKSHLRR